MRDAHHHQSFGCEAEGIKTGAMRRAVFGDGYFFDDPEDGTSFPVMPSQTQSKASCCRNMGLSWRRDLMQGTRQEPAAKNLINGWNAQRQGAGHVFKSGFSLQS